MKKFVTGFRTFDCAIPLIISRIQKRCSSTRCLFAIPKLGLFETLSILCSRRHYFTAFRSFLCNRWPIYRNPLPFSYSLSQDTDHSIDFGQTGSDGTKGEDKAAETTSDSGQSKCSDKKNEQPNVDIEQKYAADKLIKKASKAGENKVNQDLVIIVCGLSVCVVDIQIRLKNSTANRFFTLFCVCVLT